MATKLTKNRALQFVEESLNDVRETVKGKKGRKEFYLLVTHKQIKQYTNTQRLNKSLINTVKKTFIRFGCSIQEENDRRFEVVMPIDVLFPEREVLKLEDIRKD